MSSLCFSIKNEYESLKKLNAEFVSACAKAGDPRALSADQLRALQIQKQKLERERDALEKKIEDTSWLKIYESVLAEVVETKGSFQGRTVSEIMASDVFSHQLGKQVGWIVKAAQTEQDVAWIAAISADACMKCGLLTEETKKEVVRLLHTNKFQDHFRFGVWDLVDKGETDGHCARFAATALHAASSFSFPSKEIRLAMLEEMRESPFYRAFFESVLQKAQEGQTNGSEGWSAVESFAAGVGLGLLKEEDVKKIQKEIRKQEFREQLAIYIASMIEQINTRPVCAQDTVRIMEDIKECIDRSRRQRRVF